jgi:hypothetical protein
LPFELVLAKRRQRLGEILDHGTQPPHDLQIAGTAGADLASLIR